jgi:DNA invertase Pin-like site-specific DNA recombinase
MTNEILQAKKINMMLQRGDRNFIAKKLGVTYMTVYRALNSPSGSDTEMAVLEFAEKIIKERAKRAKRIAKLIEEKEKGWATDSRGIGNVN